MAIAADFCNIGYFLLSYFYDLHTLQITHHVYDVIRSFQTEKQSPSNRIDHIVRARKPRPYGYTVILWSTSWRTNPHAYLTISVNG